MSAHTRWLARAMEAAGFDTDRALAEAAGVSPGTVGRARRTGSASRPTAEALQRACAPHAVDPLADPRRAAELEEDESAVDDLMYAGPPPAGECLARFESRDCRTCVEGCFARLRRTLPVADLPPTRAECMVAHGWRSVGGSIFRPEDRT